MVETTCFLDMLAAITLHWLLLFNTFVPARPRFSINKQTFTLQSLKVFNCQSTEWDAVDCSTRIMAFPSHIKCKAFIFQVSVSVPTNRL